MQTSKHTENFATLNENPPPPPPMKTFLVWIANIQNENSNFEVLIMRSVNMEKFEMFPRFRIFSYFVFVWQKFAEHHCCNLCQTRKQQWVSRTNGGICTNHGKLIDRSCCVCSKLSVEKRQKAPFMSSFNISANITISIFNLIFLRRRSLRYISNEILWLFLFDFFYWAAAEEGNYVLTRVTFSLIILQWFTKLGWFIILLCKLPC